ncbi:hypothetical protein ACFVVU_38685 [Kitasatospora sp. NPDC057965]|uniref:hypothetical protein n=1 Tax=Kitasatospora sp. NPDC057965 TaxID=3346291 RepID=UPI0036DA6D4C
MTSPARQLLGTGPQPASASPAPAPTRPARPVLPGPATMVEDIDQVADEPAVPVGRRRLWNGPCG